MKKLLFLVAAVGFILVLAPADNAQASAGDQVAICHFPGHVGGTFNDFVTTSVGIFCVNDGGNVIIVGQQACEKGHKAGVIDGPIEGRNCSLDNIGRLDPDNLRGNP